MTGTSEIFERHLLVAVDAVGYGKKSDKDQSDMQSGIKSVLSKAAVAAGVDRPHWKRQKGGDGELAVLPVNERDPRVVDNYARQLDLQLATYNAAQPRERWIRLRMAIHFGNAMPGKNGWVGQGVVIVSRLVDSPPVRDALAAAPDSALVLALTRQMYEDVVLQGHVSFSAADFSRVHVRVKEFQDDAWIKVFGASAVSPPHEKSRSQEAAAEPVDPRAHGFVQTFYDTDARGAVFGISYNGTGGN